MDSTIAYGIEDVYYLYNFFTETTTTLEGTGSITKINDDYFVIQI